MKIKRFINSLIGVGAIALSSHAMADDGCKLVLCLGAKNPMGVAECSPVIKNVLTGLSQGKPLPNCLLSNGMDSRSTGTYVAYRRAGLTAPCPNNTTPGVDEVIYHAGEKSKDIRYSPFTGWTYLPKGVSNVKASSIGALGDTNYKQRICLKGTKLDSIEPQRSFKTKQFFANPPHEWWSNVYAMTPDNATYELDLYVDNKLYTVNRF